jgi:hypothetical protein
MTCVSLDKDARSVATKVTLEHAASCLRLAALFCTAGADMIVDNIQHPISDVCCPMSIPE